MGQPAYEEIEVIASHRSQANVASAKLNWAGARERQAPPKEVGLATLRLFAWLGVGVGRVGVGMRIHSSSWLCSTSLTLLHHLRGWLPVPPDRNILPGLDQLAHSFHITPSPPPNIKIASNRHRRDLFHLAIEQPRSPPIDCYTPISISQ